MGRPLIFFLLLFGALLVTSWAYLAPIHVRAVDAAVIERIGQGGETLIDSALRERSRSVVQLQLQTATQLGLARTNLLQQHLQTLPPVQIPALGIQVPSQTKALELFMQQGNLANLEANANTFELRAILHTRALTNTPFFAPIGSAAGRPLEASILLTASLWQAHNGKPEVFPELIRLISSGDGLAIETFYLDVLALAKRLTWEQLVFVFGLTSTVQEVAHFAEVVRQNEMNLAPIISAAAMTRDPRAVADYLLSFPESGVRDLTFALAHGSRGLRHLLELRQPIYHPYFRDALRSSLRLPNFWAPWNHIAQTAPVFGIALKFALLFIAGFMVALATRFTKSRTDRTDPYTWFPQFRFARQGMFAIFFLMLVIVLGEPYIAQGEAKAELPPRAQVTFMVAQTSPAPIEQQQPSNSMIDQYTILALFMFLVIQGLLYLAGLIKLAEIRKQNVSSGMKLKLLDNEENLFDSGLYVGLFGTVASLVLLAMGIIKPSLVAAYSSTMFGILFVAILKIAHVRPYKRRLLLEGEPALA